MKIAVKIEDVEISYEESRRTTFEQDSKMINALIEDALYILFRKRKERQEQSDELGFGEIINE